MRQAIMERQACRHLHLCSTNSSTMHTCLGITGQHKEPHITIAICHISPHIIYRHISYVAIYRHISPLPARMPHVNTWDVLTLVMSQSDIQSRVVNVSDHASSSLQSCDATMGPLLFRVSLITSLGVSGKCGLQEVEIALAEEAFQKDRAQLAEMWAQRAQQFQQAVDLQVSSMLVLQLCKQAVQPIAATRCQVICMRGGCTAYDCMQRVSLQVEPGAYSSKLLCVHG